MFYDDTIDLKLTSTAIDDTSRNGRVNSFADILYSIANGAALASTIDSGLKAANPLKPAGCDSQTCTTFSCVCWYSSGIEYMGLSIPGPAAVSLTPVSGGLLAHARLPNVAIKLRVHGDVGKTPYDTMGWVTYSFLDVQMTLDVALSGGKPRATIRPSTVTTTVGTVMTNFSGVDAWIVNNVVMPLAQGSLQNRLKSQVQNYISNNFLSALDGVVSGLEISTPGPSFDVPRLDGTGSIPLSFLVGFSSLSITATGMLVGMSSRFTAEPGQALPSLGVAIPPGIVLDDPTVVTPASAATAIHVGVFNRALHALWRGQMFQTTLSGAQLGNGLPAEASAQITTNLPPVVAISGSSVELSLGAMQLAVTYPGLFGGVDRDGKPLPPLQVALGAYVDSVPTLTGNNLQFGIPVISELHFSTGDVSLDTTANQALVGLLQAIVQRFVERALNDSLPALPIPSFSLPASLQSFGLGPGSLGLASMSLGFDMRHFVLRGPLGLQ